jgi:uncharacterized repeat protein (TIGR01451 family)
MTARHALGVTAFLTAVVAIWLVVTSGLTRAAAASPIAEPLDPGDPITLLRSDASGIEFAVDISGLELEQEMVNGVRYDVLSVPGFGSSTKAGSPQVPSRRILLGIPLDADYQLRVSAEEVEELPGQFRLLPVPTPLVDLDPAVALDPAASASRETSWEYVENELAYSADELYPQAIARVVSSGFVRDQRYVSVQVNPVQYNPVSGELFVHKRFTVEIEFGFQRGAKMGSSQPVGSFEPVLSASLLNYESAASWRGRQSMVEAPVRFSETVLNAGSPAYKILVNEDGIYQVTAADLVAQGIPVTDIPTRTYRLEYRGQEVPIRVLESDGSFAAFWFYGEKAQSKYTDTNVYWLTYGGADGLRMSPRSAPPTPEVPVSTYYSTTVRLEEDKAYISRAPWAEGLDPDPWDHWFWTYTRYPYASTDPDHPPEMAFPVQLTDLSTSAPYSATLRASLVGWTTSDYVNPDHCLRFYLNRDQSGVPVGMHTWDGQYREELVSFSFPNSRLFEGSNTVDVQVCETGAYSDIAYYDWFELDLRRKYQADGDLLVFGVAAAGWQYRLDGFSTGAVEVFDISDTYTVSRLVDAEVTGSNSQYTVAFYDVAAEQGTRYLALTIGQVKSPLAVVKYTPTNLADPATHADYIVIAPRELITAVQPLVGHRAAQGFAVQLAELESIFDEFNYGIYSPEAIHDFLSYAYHNWSGEAPEYVLLVGDGTYDYKGNLSQGNPNLLPPYMAWVDPEMGMTAADNRYVTVAGDDPFPDMHIGRLPAETTAQLSAMVTKIIAYETPPAPRDWVERVLFVADNPDEAGNFYTYSDDLINDYTPGLYIPVKAYYANTCLTADACTQVILDTLNTTGALLVNYIGHGAPKQWAGEALWTLADLDQLAPTDRYPVILGMTCREGAFYEPRQDALAESVVRLDGRGAVASWSATGFGVATGHHYLNKGFFQAALSDGVRELGAAADTGKVQLFATGYYTDLLETYHLFGDPAMRLNSLDVVDVAVGQTIEAPAVPLPNDLITITLAFTNTGPDVAAGGRLTDLLPIELVNPVVTFTSPEVLAQQEGITFAWTIDDLPPGASGTIVVEATVDPELPSGSDISFFNQARIAVQTHDLQPRNNVSWAGVNLKPVYLPLILKGFRP